jgi:redox-sensing transcriptional repressor
MKKKKLIPEIVIIRLASYLRCLKYAKSQGEKVVRSSDISILCGIKPDVIRRDFSHFGDFGVRGRGYGIDKLIVQIRKNLGINRKKNVILIGVGSLGTALLKYQGFRTANFNFIAAFDINPKKIGKKIGETIIYNIKEVNSFIEKNKIKIALLTVPTSETIKIINNLDSKYIKGILNFTSTILPARKNNIYIRNIDLARELEVISFCMNRCNI